MVDRKSLVLLLAYMLGLDTLTRIDQTEIETLLKNVPHYVEIMLEMCRELNYVFRMTRG